MEMNLHAPQSVEAATELREIAAVPLQIVSPRESVPIVSVVQDTLVGANRFTRPNVLFTKKEAMNLLIHAKRWDGKLPEPVTTDPQPMWSGQQLLSTLLPPVSLQMPNNSYTDEDKKNPNSQNLVKILNGQILQGILDKSVFSKQLLHIIYNDYGPDMTVDFLDSLQAMIANFLMNSGFSVGISDLIADEATNQEIGVALQKLTKTIEDQILQLHTGLFENSSGRSNQEEFEGKLMATLNKAVGEAGKIGLKSLADTNRMTNMVKAGSKGSDVNVSQMIATLGQQAIEGKRVPNGFQHRTLPHFKRFDDSAQARGFITSSYIKGLQPDEFFFHAMSGREGLIDTAVKSVSGDTEVVIVEDGIAKHVAIGEWIDKHLAINDDVVQHIEENNMEYLELSEKVYIPTADENGIVTWGEVKAVTRHDPGKQLYAIKTMSGREVTVTEAQSLLVWDGEKKQFLPKLTPEVTVDDYVPVTMNLPVPPVLTKAIDVSKYLPKSEYLYGTDYTTAVSEMKNAMEGREHIPNGWWQSNNGVKFHLPYDSKARLQRATVRSNMSNVKAGHVYPFTTNRDHALIPEMFELNEQNGILVGLFLAEGNADIKSGYVQITNKDEAIKAFVKSWFDNHGIKHTESTKVNHIGGVSSCVRGFSTVLASLFTELMGHGAEHKHVPSEAFNAPEEFVVGLLNGYFSGDGTLTETSVEASSSSKRLSEGISMLCSRIGVFAKLFTTKTKSNNLGTSNILPAHRLSIRGQWATQFKQKVSFIDVAKNAKLQALCASSEHRNYSSVKDVVMDKITEIHPIDPADYPKMYDLTVPSTFNFGLANGLQVRDTADTGYMQRQIRVALEDLITQHDGSVRDATGNLLQIAYGEDGINATKLEGQPLPIAELSDDDIRNVYSADGASGEEAYMQNAMEDRNVLVEKVFNYKPQKNVKNPVHIDRLIHSIKYKMHLKDNEGTVTGDEVLEAQEKILARTHRNNRIWGALVRYHLRPQNLKKNGYTRAALDALAEQIVLKHWQSWVEPGQPVGVIAAQSIGEPATQMCCISSTVISIGNGKDFKYYGTIKDFIDPLLEAQKENVTTIAQDSVVLPLKDDYYIVGVSDDEKTSWKRISEISRHPANGGLVEVVTRTGRRTTATLTHSFLKRSTTGIVPVLGSDLKVGMRIPVARYIPEAPGASTTFKQGETTFVLDKEFGWVCGIYLADGSVSGTHVKISKIHPVVEERLSAFAAKYNIPFATRHYKGEYGPSKENNLQSKDLKDFLLNTFKTGSYEKQVGALVFHANKDFIAGVIGGFFDGDGNISVERQLIRASSRSKQLIEQMCTLLGYHGMFGIVSSEQSIRIKDKIQHTLNVPRKYAEHFEAAIGLSLSEKAAALREIVKYNERDDAHNAQEMVDKIPELGNVIAETGRMLKMPGQSRTYGRWAKKDSIGRRTLQNYVSDFEDMLAVHADADVEAQVRENVALLKSALAADVMWDEIVELIHHADPKEYVYDFTVPGNDSFMVDNNILVHNTLNTFHLAGVAAKSNMTRGVPRLKELLKATRNPKAIELTIPLRRDIRNKKEEARRVAQELEFTLLQDLVTVARIYYDPKDANTSIEADREWLAYMHAYEQAQKQAQEPDFDHRDPLAEQYDTPEDQADKKSPWILRFELDRERMFNKNITMDDIAYILKSKYGAEISVLYTDYNASRLVFRIRMRTSDAPEVENLNLLKLVQNKILSYTAIRGIPGLRAVNYQKVSDTVEYTDGRYASVDQYVLISDGSNFREVLTHPDIDPTRVVSSNVHDMFENLGIEATRATLFKEITTLFAESGSSVNYRHVCILIDKMCHKGRTMSVDRYGINKNDIGPLAKMSFEQTEDIALRAAMFGERDPALGVSSKVMLGAPIRAGTAFTELLYDEEAAFKLAETTPEQTHASTRCGKTFTTEELEDILYGDKDGACSAKELAIPVGLPSHLESIAEEAMEEVDIAIVE